MSRTKKNTTKNRPSNLLTFIIALFILLFSIQKIHGLDTGTVIKYSFSIPSERVWLGPYLWANRLQDWRCVPEGIKSVTKDTKHDYRTVHILSHRIGKEEGIFQLNVEIKPLSATSEVFDSFAGFLIGAGRDMDFQSSALVHHSPGVNGGIMGGMDENGRAIFRDFSKKNAPVIGTGKVPAKFCSAYRIQLQGNQKGEWIYLWLYIFNAETNELLSDVSLEKMNVKQIEGNIGLVSHPGKGSIPANFIFQNVEMKGSKVAEVISEEKDVGPIIGALYTISRGNLYLSAQLFPLGASEGEEVSLEIERGMKWFEIARAKTDLTAWVARFEVPKWEGNKDIKYRVVTQAHDINGKLRSFAYYGTIRKEPKENDTFVLAGFTGSRMVGGEGVDTGSYEWTPAKVWFPHADLVSKVKYHNPDFLFFSGDQIYEYASPTQKEVDILDYLYRWYLWHWSFRYLTRERPTVCIPDDHDVYQGNLWGAGGRPTKQQDDGGYVYSPEFVNVAQKTQTANLPPPFDPTSVEQGITVYYTDIVYSGISMAILEDRKFKSSPKELLPDSQCDNGWFQNYNFDPKKEADVPNAVLLGDRQMKFLNAWVEDWSYGTQFKVVLSQTLYASASTLPANETRDNIIPKLELYPPEEYPEFYAIKADADTNGWPPSARNDALRLWRKCFAVHICGDQHLGITVQYGVEQWNDSSYAFAVPALGTRFPRRWFPPLPGKNRKEGAPRYTGEYEDGFGNKITVHAVANPMLYGIEPQELYNPATGYGIIRLKKSDRTITFECWPRWVSPALENAKPFYGWPITIQQQDNYKSEIKGYLPTLNIKGLQQPVIKIRKADDNSLIYTLRLNTTTFKPFVFQEGKYNIEILDPDNNKMQEISQVEMLPSGEEKTLDIQF
ncbi:MAG: alkaline phosphatase D family protein [Candidatus Hydrogenedens sp.]